MRFNIVYGNHGACPVHIEDTVRYIYQSLRELGHDTEYNFGLVGPACNIVMEYFSDEVAQNLVTSAQNGATIIVVATEFVTNGTFNNFEQSDAQEWYANKAMWTTRFRNFMRVAEASRAVWNVFDAQTPGYKTVIPEQKLHCIPFGHVEAYTTTIQHPDAKKNIDFLFTGSITPWREGILNQLRQTGATVVYSSHYSPPFVRNDLLARSRICLNMRQYEVWKYPSTTRYFHHIMNRSFMMAEKCEVPSSLDDYIKVVEPADLVRAALETLAQGQYSAIAAQNLERFRAERPAKPKIQALLEASFR